MLWSSGCCFASMAKSRKPAMLRQSKRHDGAHIAGNVQRQRGEARQAQQRIRERRHRSAIGQHQHADIDVELLHAVIRSLSSHWSLCVSPKLLTSNIRQVARMPPCQVKNCASVEAVRALQPAARPRWPVFLSCMCFTDSLCVSFVVDAHRHGYVTCIHTYTAVILFKPVVTATWAPCLLS